jgi:hypothetical protein
MKTLVGVLSTAGDNTILASAAGTTYTIHEYQVQLEAATATTVLLRAGAETLRRIYLHEQGSGFSVVYDTPMILPKGRAIILNLSGANSVNYMIRYT